MAKKTENNSNKPTESKISQDDLKAALAILLESDYEIPDECLVGPFKRKVDQLQARVDNLTNMVAALAEEVQGKHKGATVRVNPLEAQKKS